MNAIYMKRQRKKHRLNFYIDEDMKQHLYNASASTGTTAAEIIREALRKELNKQYKQYKDKSSQ